MKCYKNIDELIDDKINTNKVLTSIGLDNKDYEYISNISDKLYLLGYKTNYNKDVLIKIPKDIDSIDDFIDYIHGNYNINTNKHTDEVYMYTINSQIKLDGYYNISEMFKNVNKDGVIGTFLINDKVYTVKSYDGNISFDEIKQCK